MDDPCTYCAHHSDPRESRSVEGYLCTRPASHPGEHAACDDEDHPITTWDQPLGAYARHETPARDQARIDHIQELDRIIRRRNVQIEALNGALAKAEQERDEARATKDMHKARADEERARADAAESRPLSPEDITDEARDRARRELRQFVAEGGEVDRSEGARARAVDIVLTAALTPPARPDGAEEIEAVLSESPLGPEAVRGSLADFLASRGVRVVTEETP